MSGGPGQRADIRRSKGKCSLSIGGIVIYYQGPDDPIRGRPVDVSACGRSQHAFRHPGPANGFHQPRRPGQRDERLGAPKAASTRGPSPGAGCALGRRPRCWSRWYAATSTSMAVIPPGASPRSARPTGSATTSARTSPPTATYRPASPLDPASRRAAPDDSSRDWPATLSPPQRSAAPSVGLPSSTGLRFRILRPHARGGLGEVYRRPGPRAQPRGGAQADPAPPRRPTREPRALPAGGRDHRRPGASRHRARLRPGL